MMWLKVTAAVVNTNGKVFQEKADEIAPSLDVDGFQASGSCLFRFKARHSLAHKSASGEANKAGQSVVSDGIATRLPLLITGYV